MAQADEILIQVKYAGVSPFDAHVRAGWFQKSPDYQLPIILGWELSGVVFAVGDKVERFKVGIWYSLIRAFTEMAERMRNLLPSKSQKRRLSRQ